MFAGLRRRDGDLGVLARWHEHVDDIHVRVSDELPIVGIPMPCAVSCGEASNPALVTGAYSHEFAPPDVLQLPRVEQTGHAGPNQRESDVAILHSLSSERLLSTCARRSLVLRQRCARFMERRWVSRQTPSRAARLGRRWLRIACDEQQPRLPGDHPERPCRRPAPFLRSGRTTSCRPIPEWAC